MGKTTHFFRKTLYILVLLISLFFINKANATVTVNNPSLTISTCSFPSSFSTLGNIVITEGSNSDFSTATNKTIVFNAPTNFQFDATVNPTVTYTTSKNITAAAVTAISATQITITYSSSGTSQKDVLTIAGIKVKAITASTGNITATTTGTIAGLPTTVASLTSTLNTVPAQPSSITGSTSPCSGTSQAYSVTNVTGTTYNWTFPSGWTQTAGGTSNSVTVTTNGTAGTITVTPSNTCGSGTAKTLTVTPNITPTITSTSPASRNLTGTVTLGATASAGTVSWYAAATGGSALPGATGTTTSTFTTPSISTTTTYYVEASNGSCTSSARTAVTATVTDINIAISGNGVTIVNGDSTPSVADNTDFSSTQIMTSPIIKTFTIKNPTTTSINLNGSPKVTITGNAAFTVITQPTTTTLTSGSSTTFQIQFNPTISSSTAVNTTVSVSYSTGTGVYTFNIQGVGSQNFFDSDGDGVFDNVDVDDDNDGITDITEETNCNLSFGHKVNYKFLNETFGTGSRTTINTTYAATTSYSYQDATTPTDVEGSGLTTDLKDGKYTVGSSAQIASWANDYWYKGVDHTGDTNGRMAIFNASYTPGIFYTALITGALPNIPITYSFWVLNLDRSDAPGIATRIRPNIKVEFRDINDNVLQTIVTNDIPPTTAGNLSGNWQHFTANLTLNVNTFKVIFINNNTGGEGNDLALDDILINQQLCDLDGDGIADVFDLDADNDGIPDIVEAGLGNLSNGKAKVDVAWVDVNGNGLLDSAEPAAALQALDSDGDGVPNYIDLDSDNDSVFDVDESGVGNTNAVTGFVNGDGDINGDGVGDGPESETFRSKDTNGDSTVEGFGDGILDIYDYGTGSTFSSQYGNTGQGSANATYPASNYLKDTDGDGIPDYLDIKSNGSTFDIANNKLIYDYKTLDANNDGILDSTTDIDRDGIMDNFDTNTAQFGSPRDLHTKLYLDFDGRNDYGQSTAILGGLSKVSLMAWIDLNPAFSSDGVIVGQNNFLIRINSAKKLEAVVNGTTFTYNTALNLSQWYNVAATYDGTNLKLYLNGVPVLTSAKSGAITTDTSLLTIGRDPATVGPTGTKYFKGKIDEVRVFNIALTNSQLQRMVYQEIDATKTQLTGAIIPKTIAETTESAVPFTNMLRYYRMDTYKDDIIDDLTTAATDLTGTKIYNHKNIYIQQAPMPFETITAGNFSTAVNDPTKDIRGMDIMDQDWSIVKVHNDITETSNNIDLGMLVDSGKTITMNNDTKIQNDWYLKLDGKIDLQGKSQLVQTIYSDLDVTSAGSIERDQQGQSNLYNYNYWSSPVSPINTTSNNTNYTVDSMMKDGTNSAIPKNINWVSGYDGSPTSPISLSKFWLYKFDNYGNDYYNWVAITPTSTLRVGLGFTLKGSGAASNQNYVFTGKPNNGLISSNTVGADQLLLTGNPYPSALDATAFINDNPTIDGTLYFWEHYSTNNTHVLRDYQGGYAVRNLTGGVAPVASDLISGLGSSTKVPGQYIPVGQAFFVNGKPSGGGTITYKNSQRSFHKEDEAAVSGTGGSNSLFKTKSNSKTQITVTNDNDPIVKDTLMRIRIGFNFANYHRQVLLGYMNDKATSGIDYGYDALNIDDYPNDMYFVNGDNQLIIQGEGYFDENASLPIGVKTAEAGKASFIVDALENVDPEQPIYIYDNVTGTYNDIRNGLFEVNLPVGENNSRFALRFKSNSSSNDKTLGLDENNLNSNTISVDYIQNSNTLKITNNSIETKVEKVTLFSISGQSIANWKVENQDQKNIKIPIHNVSSGVYIAKLKTSKGELSKKVIVLNN